MMLYGAKLRDIHPVDIFLNAKDLEDRQALNMPLRIVHTTRSDIAPVCVALVENNSAYTIGVKEVVKSAVMLNQLSKKDRETVARLEKLNPSEPGYSKYTTIRVGSGDDGECHSMSYWFN